MSNAPDDQPDHPEAVRPPPQVPAVPPPPAHVPSPGPYHPAELDPHLAYMPMRAYGSMMALAFLFPIHFFFVRKVGLGVAFWATMLIGWVLLYIPHLIWWFVNLFLVKRWVYEYNAAVLDARRQTDQ